ncbi:39S ribosomal protein L12, mitochondrial [Chionoecetes opilio]|uniref:39S ribosomal protein L12, mitochondrial n=1 Tax=Chionoecetes opilio TaxID=41210 RepID=A0A8J5CLN5_CHIOP|nr:39S ribosomal protein L12, mitochondrial [Chionoecetes opilio]
MVYPEKIQNIVLDVSKLTLLEVADLNELLRKTLNIPDAPVMAFGAAMGSPAAAKEEEEEEEVAAPAKVQTNFTLKMNKFDATKKVPLIKEVKAKLEGFNLVQQRSLWRAAVCGESDIPKDEAEALLEAFKAVGAECVIE